MYQIQNKNIYWLTLWQRIINKLLINLLLRICSWWYTVVDSGMGKLKMIGSDKSETIRIYPKTGIDSWVIKMWIMLSFISTTHCKNHQYNVYSSLWAYPSQMAQHWLLQYSVLQQSTAQISISGTIRIYPKTGIDSWVMKIRIMLSFISTTHCKSHQYNVYSSPLGLSITNGSTLTFTVLRSTTIYCPNIYFWNN